MNKSDKYYMKHGKLELSMLDSDDDEEFLLQHSEEKDTKKDMFFDMEFPHSKKIRERKEPKVKVSKDIYSTLQTMGQFLVKSEEADIARAQKLAQIGLTLKVEDMDLPPRNIDTDIQNTNHKNVSNDTAVSQVNDIGSNEHITEAKSVSNDIAVAKDANIESEQHIAENISNDIDANQVGNIDINKHITEAKSVSNDTAVKQTMNIGSNDHITETIANSTDTELKCEYVEDDDLLERTIPSSEKKPQEIINAIRKQNKVQENKNIDSIQTEDIYVSDDDNEELKQSQIDKILTLHFGRIRGNYPDAKLLKAYIDEQISKIENYGS